MSNADLATVQYGVGEEASLHASERSKVQSLLISVCDVTGEEDREVLMLAAITVQMSR